MRSRVRLSEADGIDVVISGDCAPEFHGVRDAFGANFVSPAAADTGIAFGSVMNHVISRWRSGRNRTLVDAVYGG